MRKLLLYLFQTDDGEDDLKKGTQLLEIYALEIQMYTAQKNNKKLKVNILHDWFSLHAVEGGMCAVIDWPFFVDLSVTL